MKHWQGTDRELQALLDYQWSSFNSVYNHYLKRARQDNRQFLLNRTQFHFYAQQPCFYCGQVQQQSASHQFGNKRAKHGSYFPYFYNGLDRKDNSQGYTWENVVPCCWVCNRMKSAYTERQFYHHIQKIYNTIKGRLENG